MKSRIIDRIISIIQRYYDYDEIKIKEIRYGLESIYLTIVKLLVITIISIFTHTFKELCLLFLFYGLLRTTGFGLHAKNSLECWIFTLLLFFIIPYAIKNLVIDNNYLLILSIILLPLIILYAPADTEKRPLINSKKRKIYKIITSTISIVYILIIYFYKNLYVSKILCFSILLETLLVLPISYKLLGLKYNNYKRYKKGGTKWDYLLKLLLY